MCSADGVAKPCGENHAVRPMDIHMLTRMQGMRKRYSNIGSNMYWKNTSTPGQGQYQGQMQRETHIYNPETCSAEQGSCGRYGLMKMDCATHDREKATTEMRAVSKCHTLEITKCEAISDAHNSGGFVMDRCPQRHDRTTVHLNLQSGRGRTRLPV